MCALQFSLQFSSAHAFNLAVMVRYIVLKSLLDLLVIWTNAWTTYATRALVIWTTVWNTYTTRIVLG